MLNRSPRVPLYDRPQPEWTDAERPVLPGSPAAIAHATPLRVAFGLVAVLVSLAGSLGNALVTVNLPYIQGSLGLTPSEAAWLSAVYVSANMTANLVLYKFRQQFGMRLYAEIGLGLYASLAVLHLAVNNPTTLALLRLGSGFAAATCSTLGTLYMLQAIPRVWVGNALVVALGLSQLATPLAWILSPSLLIGGEWHRMYMFEAGLALCAFAAVVVLKLPRGLHIKVFERRDLLTFALAVPATVLLCSVIAQGVTLWWTDTPWLAWALVTAIVLFVTGLLLELYRDNPLIHMRWLLMPETIRFGIAAFMLRFLTSEQTYGAVGLLRTLGMGPDQMQPLFVVILLATLGGIALGALTFGPRTMVPQVLTSIVLFALAGWVDQGQTNLARPENFYLSQSLVAIGMGLFMGPLMLMGFQSALKHGPNTVISMIVLVTCSQAMGGLAGSAFFGSYMTHREHVHSTALTAQITLDEPLVAQRLQLQQGSYARQSADAQLSSAQGTTQLSQAVRREATVLAYNDVFALLSQIALGFFALALWRVWLKARQLKREAAAQAGSGPPSPAS
ncbi:MFS transporter [Comamonas serinivorans]|uniref:MFS transporter n=1 Tax=Comamonas serinivorans TaxID=1082851 RepID=A0A1Y0ER33_9BURK|nr:MFS transporter [Comamonas serinivorans]ARU06063.1 MFS transporter [Comamonas serinivorans]